MSACRFRQSTVPCRLQGNRILFMNALRDSLMPSYGPA